jgi:hypothetical protein
VVLVGAQGAHRWLRKPPEDVVERAQQDAAKAIAAAKASLAVARVYQSGDIAGAQRLATKDGFSEFGRKLGRVLDLSQRLASLSPAELEELAALDHELATGNQTALGLQVAQLRGHASVPTDKAPDKASELAAGNVPEDAPSTAPALYSVANDALRARDLDRAVSLAQQCVRVDPAFYNCHKILGSAWAKLAARDNSAAALANARAEYERFLALAPADDESAPKVRDILAQAATPSVTPAPTARVQGGDPGQLFADATAAKTAGRWAVATGLAQQVLSLDPAHAGAKDLLQEARALARDTYLRAYQLTDSSPDEAFRLYGEVLAMTAADDEYHLKAQARSAALAARLNK